MKRTNLILMVLAFLMAVPMSMSATKQTLGWLHFGEGETSYYDDTSTPINITFNGKPYKAWQVLNMSGVYYVPNDSKGTNNSNLKIVYLKNANLTKNIRCTKSTTNLWVIVSGNCSINYSKGTSFSMETGHLSVFGENGPNKDILTVTTSGKNHNACTDNGNMTFKDLTLKATTADSRATLTVEAGSYKMTFNNCNVTSNNPIYSKGGISFVNCALADKSMAWSSGNYYICKNGSKATNISIKANGATSTSTAKVNLPLYIMNEHQFEYKEETFNGYEDERNVKAYLLDISKLKGVKGSIYWVPSLKRVIFKNVTMNLTESSFNQYPPKAGVASNSQGYSIIGYMPASEFDLQVSLYGSNNIDLVLKNQRNTGVFVNWQDKKVTVNAADGTLKMKLNYSYFIQNDRNITIKSVKGKYDITNCSSNPAIFGNNTKTPKTEIYFVNTQFKLYCQNINSTVISHTWVVGTQGCGLPESYKKKNFMWDGSKGMFMENNKPARTLEIVTGRYLLATPVWEAGTYPKWKSSDLPLKQDVAW